MYAAPARYAGTGKAAPFMGDATTKLYLSFVNEMVEKHTEASRAINDHLANHQTPRCSCMPEVTPRNHVPAGAPSLPAPPVPQSRTQSRAPQPKAPPKWEISEEMMHKPWGAVLRALQPSAANTAPAAAPEPLKMRFDVRHAPA